MRYALAAAEVVAALIARVTRLIHQNLLLFGSPYLTRYMWQHSASWGPAGVRALAEAVGTRPEFRDDVSAAAVEVAEIAHRLRRPDLADAVKDWLAEPWQTSDDSSAPVDDSLPHSEYEVRDAGLLRARTSLPSSSQSIQIENLRYAPGQGEAQSRFGWS